SRRCAGQRRTVGCRQAISRRASQQAGRKPQQRFFSALPALAAAIPKMRGLPSFKREVFHLKGGNQLLPDTFAARLGERVHRHSEVTAIEHDEDSVTVHFKHEDQTQILKGDYLVMCVSPLVLPRIKVTPEWPEAKAIALHNTPIGMQSRVLLVTRGRFWEN